jgi:hypothetical protein
MFKAPGSAAHGGGLTSGLELRTNYNKGGSVTTPIGVGSGNQPMVPGPDGKMREAHAIPFLPFLTMGASRFGPSLMRALSGKGIGSLKNMILGGTRTAGSDVAGAGFGKGFNPVTGKIKDVVIKKGKPGRGDPGTPLKKPGDKGYRPPSKDYKPPKPDVTKNMNREQYIEFLRKKDPAKLKELFGDYGFGKFGRMSQIGRGAGASLLPTTAYGLGSSLIPEYDQKPETPFLNIGDTVFREIPEGIGDLVTSLPTGALGLLAGQGGAGFQGLGQSLQNTLYPDGPKSVKQVAEGEEINQAKVKKAAEAELRAKYEEMLGGKPSTPMMLAEAFADSAPYLAEDDLAGAAAQYTKSLGTGIKDRDTYDRGIGQMIIQKDISKDATNDAMIADALKTGDTATVSKIKKYQAAAEELGDVNALPTKGKNKIDYDSMQAGTVYADLTTATGNKYIAINSTGDDELRTNSASEAVNFANA